MANNNNQQAAPVTEQTISQSEAFFLKYKKAIIAAVIAIVVIIAGIVLYQTYVSGPNEQKASTMLAKGQQYFMEGDYQKALNGDSISFKGILNVAKEYSSTKAGNLAKYYAGICQLNLGKYDEAIDLLKSYKGKDIFTSVESQMLIGDAYAEKENPAEAVKYYEKAAKGSDNFIVAPTALWKAGMMYLQLDKKEDAVKAFQQIKDNYPESPEWNEVDKYLSYAESK